MTRLRNRSHYTEPKRLYTNLEHSVTQLRASGIVLGAVAGNLLLRDSLDLIGFNITLGVLAIYTWIIYLLDVRKGSVLDQVISSYTVDTLVTTALCYFSGGLSSPFRIYYLPIIVVAARHGFARSFLLALAASLFFVLTGILRRTLPSDLTPVGLYILVMLILPFVVSLVVGPRIHNIARFNAENVVKSQREIHRLRALNALSECLIDPLGHDEWLDEAIQGVVNLFDPDACWLYDYEESRPREEQLQLLACTGIDEKLRTRYRSIGVHIGVTGHAVLSGQIDTLMGPGDERGVLIREFVFALPDRLLPYRVAVPLMVHGRCVGVLVLANHTDPERPSEELELIQTVANQIAIAVDNARLYERERQRRAHALAISEITKAAYFGLSLDEVLQRIRDELKQIMVADLFQVWLADPEVEHFHLRVSDQRVDELDTLSVAGVPLLESAIRDGTPTDDLHSSADKQFAKQLGMKSLMALPLLGRGRTLGVIVLGYRQEVHLLPEQRPLIRTLADQIAASIDNMQLYENLRTELQSRSVLYRFMRNLSVSSRYNDACESFFAEIRQLYPAEYVVIRSLNRELSVLELLSSDGLTETEMAHLAEQIPPIQDCWAIKRGDCFTMRRGERGLTCLHLPVERNTTDMHVCMPLLAGGEALGVVEAGFSQLLSEDQSRFLSTLCEQLAEALHRIELYEKIRSLADRDSLTNVHNYGYFQQHLKLEIIRARRNRTMFSLLYLDIDHFKDFNDTFGHPLGDQLLKKFTKTIQDHIREVDLLARLGGEEFAVLLPDTNKRGAVVLAEKLRKQVEDTEFAGNSERSIVHKTVSIGIATFPEDATDGELLIRKADDALYRAKEAGRNQVGTA